MVTLSKRKQDWGRIFSSAHTRTLPGLGCFPAPDYAQPIWCTRPTFHNGASSAAAPMGTKSHGSPGYRVSTQPRPAYSYLYLTWILSPPDRGSWTLVTSRGLGSSLASESTRQHALLSLTRRINQYPHGYLGIPGESNEQA